MGKSNIEILKDYYKRVCVPLIFINEYILEECCKAKVYLYNFQKEEELQNFKKVFQEYIPFYVKNFDRILRYNLTENDDEISTLLLNKAKNIKQREGILPARPIRINGIYGEVYNDFYVRNILENERLITYLSRRSYERPNSENQGIDVVACSLKDDNIEIIFSEAKFVTDINSAGTKLKDDVKTHVNKDYINNFLQFVMQKQGDAINERKLEINNKINEFNDLIEDEDITFIEALNQMNFSVKFIFFAVFNNEARESIMYEHKIKEIITEFNSKIQETEIRNYSIEVVFVPTFNSSMDLKNKMEEWDG